MGIRGKYKKTTKKNNRLEKELRKLININYKLTNKELAYKLEITEQHFYRLNFNKISKELKEKYKKESLFQD